MAGPKTWTEDIVQQMFKEGRGQGEGSTYAPWLTTQQFFSRGVRTRVPSPKLQRSVHTFSYLERAFFLYLEFQANFLDFREQYPMDRRLTLGFADALGKRHPRYPKTGVPVVMTLDALVTMRGPDGKAYTAGWDVKPNRQLAKPRVLAKLAFHRAYCAHHGMPHYVWTETSQPRDVINNIEWARGALPIDGEVGVPEGLFSWHLSQMREDLATMRRRPPIYDFCGQYDEANDLPRGSGLRVFRLLLWTRRISMEMNVRRIERELIPRPVLTQLASEPQRAAA